MADDMYSYAIQYAKYGFAVFPIQERNKFPLTSHGFKDATTDAGTIKGWWQKWPNANIGIATGQISGGLYVIDMDQHTEGINGIRAVKDWMINHGSFPKSWMAKTGSGGWHYFFLDKNEHKNRAGIIPGVDFRGDGGYIVAPPSIHPNGNKYDWLKEFSPELVQLTTIDNTLEYFLNIGNTEPQMHYSAPAIIPSGERNSTLFKLACSLQAKGLSDKAIYTAVYTEMEEKCKDKLTTKEVQNIVKSVFKYKKGKPIYIHSDGSVTQGQREPIFTTNDKGMIDKTWSNMREAIEYDPMLYDHIKFNILANSLFVYGTLPWESTDTYRAWRNSDDANLKAYLEAKYGFNRPDKLMDALVIVGDNHKFNPVVEELERIYSDYYGNCSGAIRKLLPEYMGAEDNDYNYEVMKVYMLGAISRAYFPGCKFDYTLILYGPQGFGKSEFLRHLALCSEWFNDNFNTFEGNKAVENLAGMWIIEMAELKALKSAKDSESFKSFLTSRVDNFRAPYERRAEQRPRMCVFAGTTNNKNVFVDKTGNRRFLPVKAYKGKQTKSLFDNQEKVMEDFKRAWAEAMQLFNDADRKPDLILPRNAQLVAEKMQEEFSEEDYRTGVIQNWLDRTDSSKVCVPMLIEYALNEDVSRATKIQRREVMDILDNEIIGWTRLENKDKGRSFFAKYGKQIAFIKDIAD